MNTYYEVLGLESDASQTEIKKLILSWCAGTCHEEDWAQRPLYMRLREEI